MAKDGPQDEYIIENVGEDTIADLQMDYIKLYSDGPYYIDSHKASIDSDV